jgi:hypothetical protein
VTSASSIAKPWSSDAVRQGASPTAQSTSATTPHDRHTTGVVIIPDASLEPRRAAGRLDPADEPDLGQRMQGVVHSLQGDVADAVAHSGGDRLDAEVVTVPDGLEQSDPSRRHPQAGPA